MDRVSERYGVHLQDVRECALYSGRVTKHFHVEVVDSYLDRNTGYAEDLRCFPKSLQANSGFTTASFQIISNYLFIRYPTIRRYIV